MPRYVYGITRANAALPELEGIDDAPVESTAHQNLAVLSSLFGSERIRPRRMHLIAHEQVLVNVMQRQPVLPASFGTILTDGEGDASALLKQFDAASLMRRLDWLDGHRQVILSYELDEEAALHRVVERCPAVLDRTRAAIDRGKEIAEMIGRLAAEDIEHVITNLEEQIDTVGDVEQRGLTARVSLLIHNRLHDRFLSDVEQLSTQIRPGGCLRAAGGLPPHSFAGLDIATEPEKVAEGESWGC